MTSITQKCSKLFIGAAIRVVTLALFLVVFGASAALAQTKAYVSNANDNFISVIDTATNTVVSNIPMGGFPDGLAVTPNGKFIYVMSRVTGEVLVISTATETIVATVPVGGSSGPITITPNGALAYYADSFGTISVINTATNTLTATIPIGATSAVAFTPNSAFAYVGTATGDLKVIDTATNLVSATVNYGTGFPFGDVPFVGAITPDGALAYVTVGSPFFPAAAHISILSTATNTEVATVPLAIGISAFTPDGAFVYGVSGTGNAVIKLETATNTVVATVPASNIGSIVITPDGTLVYTTDFVANTVKVISVAGNNVVATIPVGVLPLYIGFAVTDPLAGLLGQIQALIDAGTLTQNQGNQLLNKVNQVIAKLDAGQTTAACGQLGAFINNVNALINNGSLTQAQGQALIDAANAIRASIGC